MTSGVHGVNNSFAIFQTYSWQEQMYQIALFRISRSSKPFNNTNPTNTLQESKWTKLRRLFTFNATPVSDSPKIHYFCRIRHAPLDIFEESE
ncbi:hypothetical protein H5410_006184 [Solanum commersonii]|uniref:Uncharacterized protein n=1 Tax=Solanum commersonii TaxID=4109 RepID=A0A9J6A8H3_SOLCO|nr:hypothetical protein H5410_006184 [Solanum commersonii]